MEFEQKFIKIPLIMTDSLFSIFKKYLGGLEEYLRNNDIYDSAIIVHLNNSELTIRFLGNLIFNGILTSKDGIYSIGHVFAVRLAHERLISNENVQDWLLKNHHSYTDYIDYFFHFKYNISMYETLKKHGYYNACAFSLITLNPICQPKRLTLSNLRSRQNEEAQSQRFKQKAKCRQAFMESIDVDSIELNLRKRHGSLSAIAREVNCSVDQPWKFFVKRKYTKIMAKYLIVHKFINILEVPKEILQELGFETLSDKQLEELDNSRKSMSRLQRSISEAQSEENLEFEENPWI